MKNLRSQFYPAITEVCSLLDATVLTDLWATSPEEECPDSITVFSIGFQQELSAGIRGGSGSPYFHCLELLNQFCAELLPQIRTFADNYYELPDRWWLMPSWKGDVA